MTDKFTSALLAALNESAELKESDWNSIEAALRLPIESGEAAAEYHAVREAEAVDPAAPIDAAGPVDPVDTGWPAATPQAEENRFAATISSGMAKIRSGR